MGQNNDPTERGDLQGNQGGYLARNPREHERLRQAEEGFARAEAATVPIIRDGHRTHHPVPGTKTIPERV